MATEIIAFSQDLAQQIFDSTEEFPIDFDLAWVWLGYTRKSSAKKKIETNFVKDVDYCSKWCKTPDGGRPSEVIMLTIDCFKSLGMMAGTEQGRKIRGYFLACEKRIQSAYPRRITGDMPITPTEEMLQTVNAAFDIFFPHVPIELRTGMKIEGACALFPALRPALDPHKPKLILESQLLTPTELGKLMNPPQSARSVNKLLCNHNLQKPSGQKNPAYELIGSGNEFGKVVADTARGHGKTIQHIRWYESVLKIIEA